jgi:hypothetical protein
MLLQKLGFVERAKSKNAYHSGWRRRGTLVELHHDVANPADFKFDTAGAWQRAAQIHFLGEPVWQFAPQDELLFLAFTQLNTATNVSTVSSISHLHSNTSRHRSTQGRISVNPAKDFIICLSLVWPCPHTWIRDQILSLMSP